MLLSLVFALALAEPSLPAGNPPAPAPAAAAPTTAQKADDPNEMICHREIVTGSHFATKVCRRKGDMAQKQQDDQDRLRQTQRPSATLSR